MSSLGPVSQTCAAELREMARQRGIVVWLDSDDSYSELVSELVQRHEQGEYDVPVLGFRDSYLELLLELEGREDGVGMVPLIVHVPGLAEEDMRATPLLELYRAGQRHRRALPTLIREAAHGRASADDIEAFVARGDLTLEAADTWLSHYGEDGKSLGPDLSAFDAQALFEAVRPNGSLAAKADEPEVLAAIWQRASQLLGIHEDWRGPNAELTEASTAADAASFMANEMAAWCMCVEFIDDLKRDPKEEWLLPLLKLAKPFRTTSRELVVYLRDRYDQFYAHRADELENDLAIERRDATAEDLGRIDTFRFEDQKLLTAGLDALEDKNFQVALDWAVQRTDGRSFWTQQDRSRRLAWHLVELSARLGIAIHSCEELLAKSTSISEASAAYAASGYLVDRYHRQLEQAWQNSRLIKLDEFATVRRSIEGMRHSYRAWLDHQSTAFNTLCENNSYLPGSSHQQRTLFEQVVQPWAAEDGITAYFMVDALRYEMGEQLAEVMRSAGNVDVIIKPRLAELPTLTEVGMNILAPVNEGGKLRLDMGDKGIKGFRTGETRVFSPDTRRKAMLQRVGGSKCAGLTVEEVLSKDISGLKRSIGGSRLVVIHSEEIDKSGEKGFGLKVFERELQNIRSAWIRLHEAGVKRFVITADHGFLLHDETTRQPRLHRNKTTPKRRHIISELAVAHEGEVRVSCTELGYEGTDKNFVFPKDGAPFDTGKRAGGFVHGGNSLQERVIPVITVQHRFQAGTDLSSYSFEAEVRPRVAHMHCLRARVMQQGQSSLSYAGKQEVEVTLECEDSKHAKLEVVDVRDARCAGNVISTALDSWFEVFFRVTSDRSERVRVRLAQATGASAFTKLSISERFDAEVQALVPQALDGSDDNELEEQEKTPEDDDAAEAAWFTELPDEATGKLFLHIERHGAINETDAISLLGSPRKFRKFRRGFESYLGVLPFSVRMEVVDGLTSYLRGEEN